MTDKEISAALARIKAGAMETTARREQQRQAVQQTAQRFDLEPSQPFTSPERMINRDMGDFIAQTRSIARAPALPPPPPVVSTTSTTLQAPSVPQLVRNPSAPAPPVFSEGMNGQWYNLTLCDGTTLDVWATNIVEPE